MTWQWKEPGHQGPWCSPSSPWIFPVLHLESWHLFHSHSQIWVNIGTVQRLVAWQHQAIAWSNVDFSDEIWHLPKTISHEIFKISTHLKKSHSNYIHSAIYPRDQWVKTVMVLCKIHYFAGLVVNYGISNKIVLEISQFTIKTTIWSMT